MLQLLVDDMLDQVQHNADYNLRITYLPNNLLLFQSC